MRAQRGHVRRGAAAHHGAQRLPRGDVLHVLLQPGAGRRRRHGRRSSAPNTEDDRADHRRAPARAAARAGGGRGRGAHGSPTRRAARAPRALETDRRDLPFALLYLSEADGAAATLAGAPASRPGHRAATRLSTRSLWTTRRLAVRARPCAHAGPTRVDCARRLGRAARAARWDRAAGAGRRAAARAPAEAARRRSLVARPEPVPAVRRGVPRLPRAGRRTRSPRHRERAALRGGAAARRGAGRARSREDRVLLQRQPRVPHAADADARPARGRAGRAGRARCAGDEPRDGAPQRAAAAEAGQHAARLLAHRGRPRRRPRYEPTDLAALTAELASTFRSAIERGGPALRGRLPAARASRSTSTATMWEKIVLNLLSNAFKFTFEGGITRRARARPDDAVELAVRDTGIGIPADELPRLFERFHRVEGARGAHARGHRASAWRWCSELVRLHGGSVARRQRSSAQGTTFTVTHAARHRAPAGGRIVRAARPRRDARIGADAFVEEALRWLPDADAGATPPPRRRRRPRPARRHARACWSPTTTPTCATTSRACSARAGRSRRSRDGAAALDAVRAQRARPGAHRRDDAGPRRLRPAARAARPTAAPRDIPVILLSARAGEEARIEGLEAGADDYLVKPFSARELLARVEAQLAARARDRARSSERAARAGCAARRSMQAPRRHRGAARARARLRARQPALPRAGRRPRRRRQAACSRRCPELAGQGVCELLDEVYAHAASRTSARSLRPDGRAPARRRARGVASSTSSTSRSATRDGAGRRHRWSIAFDVTEQWRARRARARERRPTTAPRTSSSRCSATSCATRWRRSSPRCS